MDTMERRMNKKYWGFYALNKLGISIAKERKNEETSESGTALYLSPRALQPLLQSSSNVTAAC